MQVKREELQRALQIVKPGLSNKDVIEQATSFAFIEGRVVTYNDEISISHPITGLNLEGAIKADQLYNFLSKLTKEDVDITIKDKEILISAGKSKAGIPLQMEIKLPLKQEISHFGKWQPLPERFLDMVRRALPSCSKDMSRPVLTCVHVSQKGFIEASDNYRIAQCDLKEEMPIKSFLIPASSALQVVKMKVLPTEVAEGKGWIHFKNEEDTVISCRIIEEAYPNISKYLNVEGKKLVLPKTIAAVLDRASVFYERDHDLDEAVIITLKEDKLIVKAMADAGGTTGWFKEELNMAYSDEPVSFSITPYLLQDIITESAGCILGEDKLKFEGDGWVYISVLKVLK